MEKEKIEKAIKILLKEDRFYDDETEIKATKVLSKYINNLEQSNKILDEECSRLKQKETILDKVTDKLKETIKKERELMPYLPHKSASFHYANGREVLAKEILNIIEGEKK